MITAGSSNPVIRELLAHHPEVSSLFETSYGGVEFVTNRRRHVGFAGGEVGGVVELMDNNPLVCAEDAWVPSPGGALSVLALGPLLEAGLVVEPPAILLSFEDEEAEIARALAMVAYTGGFALNC